MTGYVYQTFLLSGGLKFPTYLSQLVLRGYNAINMIMGYCTRVV